VTGDPIGVLVMAHGTPATPRDIEPFYTRIRRGSPPSPDQLADLRRRYDAIGGTSPLAERTAGQVAGITAALEARHRGRFRVAYGAKHTDPSIEAAAVALASSGVSKVVGLVLAPHRSSMGSGQYLERAAGAIREHGTVPFVGIAQWYDAPGFPELIGERLNAALESLPETVRRPAVVFSAHSLPERVVAEGDPYPEQLAASAAAIAGAVRLGTRGIPWQVAWQSAGRTADRWLGPDVLDVLGDLARRRFDGAVVCPVGFVADHLEVLYDLDIEARGVAHDLGLAFSRTASLNDDPDFVEVLAEVVCTAAADDG